MSRPPAAAVTSSKSNPFSTPTDSLLTASSSPSTSRTPSPVGTASTIPSTPARGGPRQRAYSLREGRGGQAVGAGAGAGAAGMREKQRQGKQETSLMMSSTGLSTQARKDARKLEIKQKIKRNIFMIVSAIGVGGIITATILGIKGML